MNSAEYIARYLEKRGVTQVFELVGGMITFLLDALHQHSSIRIVSMHHEQGAAFAADGAGRITGIPGIAMATSGPGATNLLTGIGSCYFDSVPAVFITGQVNRHEQKGERAIRQLGFQETDIVAMAKPITKAAWMVRDAADLRRMLDEAFALAMSGRPGPVLLDIPMDVQRATISEHAQIDPAPPPVTAAGASELAEFCASLNTALAKSQRPLVLAGGGIRSGRAIEEFREFVADLRIPVIHSLMAVDVLPAGDPLRGGMLGSYGNRWTNLALSKSDLLLVLGSRLDVRQTGADTADFKGERAIFHVDCEPGELNNRVTGCRTLISELAPFLTATRGRLNPPPAIDSWISQIASLREQWSDTAELASTSGINPNEAMHVLSRHSVAAVAYSVDVGQHQMWAAQSLDLTIHQRFITSGGMGSMGFALPAGIGACVASGQQPVVIIAGDGGFQCNIQELQTVRRNSLPLKIVVFNNGCHGMVRQFQESYFHARYQSTMWGYDAPNFSSVAGAYDIPSARVQATEELDAACARMWSDPAQPFLLEVLIDPLANAYPKMAFGRPISEMEPFAKPVEMEGT
jgi:acetolactate synthase-1/2/3 large subunit